MKRFLLLLLAMILGSVAMIIPMYIGHYSATNKVNDILRIIACTASLLLAYTSGYIVQKIANLKD